MVVTNEQLVTSLRRAANDVAANRSIRDLDQMLGQIVSSAVETVPHAHSGGISVVDNGQTSSRNPSTATVARLDQLQSELGEGPCISALIEPSEDGLVLAEDLAGTLDSARWPRFARVAVASGYQSILSTQLFAGSGMRAALNLYGTMPYVFDAEARLTAGLFGVQATMLLYGTHEVRQMQLAVRSRDVIGQAKGILMERFTLDDNEAFQLLINASQDTNIKLTEVATWLQADAREQRRNRADAGHAEEANDITQARGHQRAEHHPWGDGSPPTPA